MRFAVEKIKIVGARNINREEIDCRFRYIIAVKRLIRKKLYLRLLPVNENVDYRNVQFTSWENQATSYKSEKEAKDVIADIKTNPNNYRL